MDLYVGSSDPISYNRFFLRLRSEDVLRRVVVSRLSLVLGLYSVDDGTESHL